MPDAPVAVQCVVAAAFGRHLDVSSSLMLLVVLESVFFGMVVIIAGFCGAPRMWPRTLVALTAVIGVTASVVWWWVNPQFEGEVLVEFSAGHGITTADLLSVPMLIVTVLVVGFKLVGRRSRSPG